MNRAMLIGRLTRDPDIRYNQENKCVARFTLAVDRKYTGKDGQKEADFISCVCFGKTAEFIEKYITKGRKIAVEGEIRTGSYEDKDGKKVYTTDVMVDSVDFCDSNRDGGQQDNQSGGYQQNSGYQQNGYQGQNNGYQNQGYQNQGYQQGNPPQQGGYQNQGYQNGYQNQGYPPQGGYNDGFAPAGEYEGLPFKR